MEIRYQDNEIDEVVAEGRIHLERLDNDYWMLTIDDGEARTMLRLLAHNKIFGPRLECDIFAHEPTR